MPSCQGCIINDAYVAKARTALEDAMIFAQHAQTTRGYRLETFAWSDYITTLKAAANHRNRHKKRNRAEQTTGSLQRHPATSH